jgi:hypothetical protein
VAAASKFYTIVSAKAHWAVGRRAEPDLDLKGFPKLPIRRLKVDEIILISPQ